MVANVEMQFGGADTSVGSKVDSMGVRNEASSRSHEHQSVTRLPCSYHL